MYKFDSMGLLRRAFGLANARIIRPYTVGEGAIKSSSANPYDAIEVSIPTSEVKSILGTPVLMPCNIRGGRYRERLADGSVNFIEYTGYSFPYTTITEVNLPKFIVKTNIPGRNGTVKEYISNDDYQVNFRGIIVNHQDDLPPEDGIREFNAIMNVPAPLTFEMELLEWLGIGQLVVERANIFQLEGFSHVVGFQLSCISDEVTEVRLRDGL